MIRVYAMRFDIVSRRFPGCWGYLYPENIAFKCPAKRPIHSAVSRESPAGLPKIAVGAVELPPAHSDAVWIRRVNAERGFVRGVAGYILAGRIHVDLVACAKSRGDLRARTSGDWSGLRCGWLAERLDGWWGLGCGRTRQAKVQPERENDQELVGRIGEFGRQTSGRAAALITVWHAILAFREWSPRDAPQRLTSRNKTNLREYTDFTSKNARQG